MTSPLPPVPDWLAIPQGERAQAMAMQFQLQQTQFASPAAMAELQLQMLQRLVAHAVTTTAFYRERLGENFRLNNWQQWSEIPVLTRAELQIASAAMVSSELPAEQGKTTVLRTSGSTGRPVTVTKSYKCAQIHRAISHRDHLWQRHQLTGRLAIIRFDGHGKSTFPGIQAKDWADGSAAIFPNGPSFLLDSKTPTTQQWQWLHDMRAEHLLTYPSLILELARINEASATPLRLKGISTLGEMLFPHQRIAGEASFGCRIADLYSAQEIGYMALQCPRYPHYHVQSENCLVEILDANNQRCSAGETGRVVVTPLHNLAQPLLRYEIGDHAVAGAPCDCGIRLPVIERILGRTRNLVVLPDGSRAWPAYNPMKLMDLLPGAQFQVVQESRTSVCLRVAGMTNTVINDDTRLAACAIVRAALGPFDVRLEQVNDIPRSAGGKYEEFVCMTA